jgi:hypothetical protein
VQGPGAIGGINTTEVGDEGIHSGLGAAAGIKDPVGCYKKIFGPIKYVMETRTAWEAWMSTFMWAKKSRSFDPMKYGLEDLVQDPTQATQ